MSSQPLLMIPGPIAISPAVQAAASGPPTSHVAPATIRAFGTALLHMRQVWKVGDDHLPFVVAGGGTLAMEAAVCNLVDPGHTVLVVNTGTFGDRMAEINRRRGANVLQHGTAFGEAADPAEVMHLLETQSPHAVFITHVDTSSAVRNLIEPVTRRARELGILSVVDGVCAMGAETLYQADWSADVVLTASQKAIGLPAGLALWMVSPQAMAARRRLRSPPPLCLDWLEWAPVLEAYENGQGAYFSTPPTTMIPALEVGLGELLDEGMETVWARHERAGQRMRNALSALGLRPVSQAPARTLTALYWPDGVGPEGLAAIAARGVTIAGGLYAPCRATYFRVGHMGEVTRDEELLWRTVEAVGKGLGQLGAKLDLEAARTAFSQD